MCVYPLQSRGNITIFSWKTALSNSEIFRQWISEIIFTYRTYFIEYEFPVAADHGSGQSDKNGVGLEITRIATKKTNAQSKSAIKILP